MLLAFDASTDWLTIAISDKNRAPEEVDEFAPRSHLSRLLPRIDDLLGDNQIKRSEITVIGVGIGPGSFTGTRIAVAVAQGMAMALNIPIIGVSTLDTIAAALFDKQKTVFSALGARKNEVYWAGYRNNIRFTDYRVTSPKELARDLSKLKEPMILAGDGFVKNQELFLDSLPEQAVLAANPFHQPRASVLINLAKEKIHKVLIDEKYKALPIYIKLSDAEEALKRKISS